MVDIATLIGLITGFTVLVTGILMRTEIKYYADLASVFITIGGSTAAVIAQFPIADLLRAPLVAAKAFITRPLAPHKLIRDMVRYAEIARRDGILALEGVTEEITDDFLVKGLQLAVDGTDPELIHQMMNTELQQITDRHEKGKRIFEALVVYLPAFGMAGTLIGLIAMLRVLDNPKLIGPKMALALLTTLYGVIGAYLVCRPISEKLEMRSQEETLLKEMIIRGVMSIQSGDNPRIVEQKLKIYLAPRMREGETR